MRQVRRIVTTDDANGKSEVLIDGVASRTITVLTETCGSPTANRPTIGTESTTPKGLTGWSRRRWAHSFRYFEIAPESGDDAPH